MRLVSSIFGQGRSDYVNFTDVGVPNVFFSDSTGPCYHTAQDELGVVDFVKLDEQVRMESSVGQSRRITFWIVGCPADVLSRGVAAELESFRGEN